MKIGLVCLLDDPKIGRFGGFSYKRRAKIKHANRLILCSFCSGRRFWCDSVGPPAQDDSIPPPLATYKGREIAQTMHYLGAPWLTRESRDREEDCKTMLAALQVKPGDTVCDMGCGNGFYTLELAELVGERGKVIAVDIQREMLEMLKDRPRPKRRSRTSSRCWARSSIRSCRAARSTWCCWSTCTTSSRIPEQMLAAIRKSLKPTGRVALVEFRAEDPDVPIKPLHKMSKAQIMKEFPPNGFKLVEEFDKLPWQHLMFFQRDDAAEKTRRQGDGGDKAMNSANRIAAVSACESRSFVTRVRLATTIRHARILRGFSTKS